MAHVYSAQISANGAGEFRVDGRQVAAFDPAPAAPVGMFKTRLRQRTLNPQLLADSKLCVERAWQHYGGLESLVSEWGQSAPASWAVNVDPVAAERVCTVNLVKPIPTIAKSLAGDALQNLRSALDIMVCDLIRANGNQPGNASGFPLSTDAAAVARSIKGISPDAEKLLLGIKARSRWNSPIWLLHNLNRLHKHNKLVVVSAATVKLLAQVHFPGISFGDGPLHSGGAPRGSGTVLLKDGENEVYRTAPEYDQRVQVEIGVVFGEGDHGQGEAVLPTIFWLTELVTRIIVVCERRLLGGYPAT